MDRRRPQEETEGKQEDAHQTAAMEEEHEEGGESLGEHKDLSKQRGYCQQIRSRLQTL